MKEERPLWTVSVREEIEEWRGEKAEGGRAKTLNELLSTTKLNMQATQKVENPFERQT